MFEYLVNIFCIGSIWCLPYWVDIKQRSCWRNLLGFSTNFWRPCKRSCDESSLQIAAHSVRCLELAWISEDLDILIYSWLMIYIYIHYIHIYILYILYICICICIYIYICVWVVYVVPPLNDISVKSAIGWRFPHRYEMIMWWSFHDFLHPFWIGIALEFPSARPWTPWSISIALLKKPKGLRRRRCHWGFPVRKALKGRKGFQVYEIGTSGNETQLIGFRWWFHWLVGANTLDAYIVLATLVTRRSSRTCCWAAQQNRPRDIWVSSQPWLICQTKQRCGGFFIISPEEV